MSKDAWLCWEVRSIQNEYICNADITPIWDDIRIVYMNELCEIGLQPLVKNKNLMMDIIIEVIRNGRYVA